jgi:hypothetical protein
MNQRNAKHASGGVEETGWNTRNKEKYTTINIVKLLSLPSNADVQF